MGKQVTEEQISDWMKTEIEKKPDIKVLIRSDQDAKHLYLANVMSICRHVGVPRANIAVKTER
jgi:biopolymer transport protein ExbD